MICGREGWELGAGEGCSPLMGAGAPREGAFSPRLWGGRVGNLFSLFPLGGTGAEVGVRVLWEGGWENI